MARATHLWIRHLETVPAGENPDHLAFVGGMITGLCGAMHQPPGAERWVAYVYALLDGHGIEALRRSQKIVSAAANALHQEACRRGRAEAPGIVAWLALPAVSK